MFIIYTAYDEIIVTTRRREDATLEEFFGEDMGRNMDEYDRTETNDPAVMTTSTLHSE